MGSRLLSHWACARSLIFLSLIAAVTASAQSVYEPYKFSVFAGNPPGSIDGPGSTARFDGPFGTAVDDDGNIYVADANNNTIRKITPGGVVSTLAGSAGMEGSDDGLAGAARFFGPKGVAVDGAGNVYVADSGNDTIRRIAPSGLVSTIAGSPGIPGCANGTGRAARFNFPTGIAADADGNLYVADNVNNTIRKITPAGVVTTLAGLAGVPGITDGIGSSSRFNAPGGVAVDGSQSVYVVDSGNHTIRKITIDPDGVATVITLAGLAGKKGSVDETGDAARFDAPLGVAVDLSGSSIYVADTQNDTIRKVTATGVVTTLAGAAGIVGSEDGRGGTDGIARFGKPRGIAVGGGGFVYVADTNNNTLRRIDLAGVVSTVAGFAGSGSENGTGRAARFNSPAGVALDRFDNAYITDNNNQTIRKITPTGVVTTFAGTPGVIGSADGTGGAAQFNDPIGVAVDTGGNVYVGDKDNYTIRKITPAGVVTTFAGTPGVIGSANGTGGAAQFNQPTGVATDADNNVYVADSMNDTIRKITPAGVVTTLAGTPGVIGSANGTGGAAQFNQPKGVAVDQKGTIYVGDTNNHTIRKINPAGVVTTLAGLAGSYGGVDGMGPAARFFRPKGVAVDTAGNVYVGDSNNHTIRKINPTGVVTTLAGLLGRFGGADGTGNVARFHFPTGVAVDSAGEAYIADDVNSIIRVGVTAAPVITSPGAASGIVGTAFAYQFTAAGASDLEVDGSPPGLTFDKSVSAIVGKATAAGTFSVGLSASNSVGATKSSLIVNIHAASTVEMNVVSGSGLTGAIGQPFTYRVKAGQASPSATITAAGLPPGLSIDQTGLISGVLSDQLVIDQTTDLVTSAPVPDGSSPVKLVVSDGGSSTVSTLQLTFTSDPALPVIISPTQANVAEGQPFSYTINAPTSADPTAGAATYSISGTPPPGLTFDAATGTISGIYNQQAEQKSTTRVWKGLNEGPPNIVGSVQLFAKNRKGTATIPLIFTKSPPRADNISTRVPIGINDDVLIGGFIITGNAPSKVLIRGIGPSLNVDGVPVANALQDPILELRDSHGSLLFSNDDWGSSCADTEIVATGLAPTDDRESAILMNLAPGSYTAILGGRNSTMGIGLVEVYDLGTASLDASSQAQLANISTRGKVQTGDGIMIGGFIIGGNTSSNVLVRALGPELTAQGVAGALPDPVLELLDSNGVPIASNDDWESDQEAEIFFTNLAPTDPHESAILRNLSPGSYTAKVSDKNGNSGVALVEVYVLPP